MQKIMQENESGLAVVREQDLALIDENILNANQYQVLLKATPKRYVHERPAKGGGKWKYVTGGYVKKQLNLLFGFNWDFIIVNREIIWEAKQVIVEGKLVCRTGGHTITKTQFGRADIKFKTDYVYTVVENKEGVPVKTKVRDENGKPARQATSEPLDLGNDLKAAATDALKKCASELGIAADIYNAEEFRAVKVLSVKEQKHKEEEERILRGIENCDTVEQLSEVYNGIPDEIKERHPELESWFSDSRVELEMELEEEGDEQEG